jgi:hypothetical protein
VERTQKGLSVKKIWLTALALGFVFSLQAQADVLSYKQWRNRRIQEARATVTQIKDELAITTKDPEQVSDIPVLEAKLRQAVTNVEIAKELNSNDYFVLYLIESFPNDPNVLKSVAKRMSWQEMADILENYRTLLKQPAKKADAFDSLAIQNFEKTSSPN